VYFYYFDESGERQRVLASMNRTASDSGVVAPTSSSVAASRTVTIYDDMPTRFSGSSTSRDCGTEGVSVKEFDEQIGGTWYLDDIAPNSSLFNVVEVRVVVW